VHITAKTETQTFFVPAVSNVSFVPSLSWQTTAGLK
jgi:hypothetical protein